MVDYERMMSSAIRYSAVLAAAVVFAACRDQTAPRGPKMLYAAPNAQIAQVAAPGTAVAAVPTVRVEIDGTPIANVQVRFTVTRGGGTVATAVVTTDAQGIADCGAWTLGADGANELLASIGGDAWVTFDALALTLATGGEVYDLFSHNGVRLPASVGDGVLYLLVAGRLVLESDSTYTATLVSYNGGTRAFNLQFYNGPFSRSGAQIMFSNYAGTAGAIAAVQVASTPSDIDLSWMFDSGGDYPQPQDDLYRRLGR